MPYCTKQNLIDRFGEEELIQLTDRENLGAIDDSVLDAALADADEEIDGKLAVRYRLPLATVPPRLVRMACDIARHSLYADNPTATVVDRYNSALDYLRAVAAGKEQLLNQGGATAETAGVAEFDPGRSVFTGGGY